jgi:hypothetical protein
MRFSICEINLGYDLALAKQSPVAHERIWLIARAKSFYGAQASAKLN